MEPYKNMLFDWAYAGDKETMYEMFPEIIPFWEHQSKEIGEDFFDKISPEFFKDKDIIEKYGKNLRDWREQRGWTLKEVAAKIHIDFQQVQQIEAGERKKINRNILLLFCAIYLKTPETLMGIERADGFNAMVFYPEDIAKKSSCIVDQLIISNIDLLDTFYYFANKPIETRQKLSRYIQNIPSVSMLTPKQIESMVNCTREFVFTGQSWERYWSLYFGGLCDAGSDTPELLDVYLSVVAADSDTQKKVSQLVAYAGFFPFSPADSND